MRGERGPKTPLEMQEKDLTYRYAQTREIGCSRGFASCDGTGHRAGGVLTFDIITEERIGGSH